MNTDDLVAIDVHTHAENNADDNHHSPFVIRHSLFIIHYSV